jgi:hypothetical protein
MVRSEADAAAYFQTLHRGVLIQTYHPGPHEAGIFYYRMPDEAQGHILSITDKAFASVTGDGRSTLKELIWHHTRYRMQAGLFLKRYEDEVDRVLAEGEAFALNIAGNHCQGTQFLDGAHLITPELEARIDTIAKAFDGFYFGRFDVRYTDVDAFKAGKDLAIVELNGAMSESTNIYDARLGLLRAWGILLKQWALLYKIGAANRANGAPTTSLWRVLRIIRSHYTERAVSTVAD